MLVLTRKVGQSILIGDGIEVAVMEIRGAQVRIGIQAPDEITVARRELVNEIQKSQAPRSAGVEPTEAGG
jgi:carbon storage regulator